MKDGFGFSGGGGFNTTCDFEGCDTIVDCCIGGIGDNSFFLYGFLTFDKEFECAAGPCDGILGVDGRLVFSHAPALSVDGDNDFPTLALVKCFNIFILLASVDNFAFLKN